jgi:predicted alpha/beta hydrolase
VTATTLSGILSFTAGIAVVAVAAATVWTSRRADGPWWRRSIRRGLGTALAVVLGLLIAVPLGMGYFVTNRSSGSRADVDFGRPHLDTTIETADGLKLAASYVPSTNRAAVIVFPGRGGQTSSRARMLVRHGYGVLILDPRGQGSSEGDPNLFGWSGEPDLRAAIDFLHTRPDVDPDRIGGLGLSVGGELMLQTAAHDQRLHAVVSEGAGSRSVAEDVHIRAPDVFVGLPFSVMSTVSTAVFGDSMPPPGLHGLVDDIAPRPIMLIWARDGNGETYFDPAYYDLAGEPKAIWEVPGSSHIDGLATRPAEYERRVIAFFNEGLGAQP